MTPSRSRTKTPGYGKLTWRALGLMPYTAWSSGTRWPSFGPIVLKSLGGSLMALLPNGHRTIASAERGVPGNADGILHALVRGAALDVYGERTLRCLHSVRGHREVVVHVYRLDPDRLADPDEAPLDGGLVGLPADRDLAPSHGPSQRAVHS